MEENWKAVIGYEGLYEVSNLGRIRSLYYGRTRVLKTYKGNRDYLIVSLSKDGKQKTYTVHRLVANAFIPNPENKPEIDHINTITTDNRVENLRYVTPKENSNNDLTRKHMSESKKGRHHSEETKRKMSE